ncbi:MAG: hypothetical protein GY765_00740, partial [bacterium]|nr:hypothetical protein [bacterium]
MPNTHMDTDLWSETFLYFLKRTAGKSAGRRGVRERFPGLLEQYAHLWKGKRFIKIAGTNGKGSVSAMLQACLARDGIKTGLFTSPHLYRVNERFRICGGKDAAPCAVQANGASGGPAGSPMGRAPWNPNGPPGCKLVPTFQGGHDTSDGVPEGHVRDLRPGIEAYVARRGEEYMPSFFEVLILTALKFFDAEGVDIAILEAGVGGSNDAVSLLPSIVSAITTIGLDHTEKLGNSLQEIAADKAGIALPDSPLLAGPSIPDYLRDTIRSHTAPGVDLIENTMDSPSILETNLEGTLMDVSLKGRSYRVKLNLPGLHQVDNFAVTAGLVEYLWEKGIVSGPGILKGVEHTCWPGRMEYLGGCSPAWLLEVAHNTHALLALRRSLDACVDFKHRVLVYGASMEKDYPAALKTAQTLAPRVYLVSGFYKSVPAAELKTLFPGTDGCFASPARCIEAVNKEYADSSHTIIAAGSVFLVGILRHHLTGRQLEPKNINDE